MLQGYAGLTSGVADASTRKHYSVVEKTEKFADRAVNISCLLLQEFRRIWLQLEAAVAIPKSRATVFRDNYFVNMSWGRFSVLLVTYLSRIAIAGVLLVAGILWLTRTTSIEELMLNAVALNSILDVDEFLFAGMTPIKVQHAVRNMQPMLVRYARRRSQCESCIHFGSLLVLVFTSYFLLLSPLSDTMLEVKNELCAGNQTFVVSYNADTQQTIGLATRHFRNTQNLSATEYAVQAHKDASADVLSGYIRFSTGPSMFQADASRSMMQEASMYPFCAETMVLKPDGEFHADPTLGPMTEMLFRSASASVGHAQAQSCEELREHCDAPEARLLRMVCGETCGCMDPFSSAWYKVEAHGCATSCLQFVPQRLQNHSCVDSPVDDTWRAFWTAYPDVLSSYAGQPVENTHLFYDLSNLAQNMLSLGCPALAQHPSDFLTGAVWCEGKPDLLRPLASICPQTCGCDSPSPHMEQHCPPSCRVA